MEKRNRYCKECRRPFDAIIAGQQRCIKCIMKKEPPLPTSNTDRMNCPDFAEWFIYKWQTIRRAAAKKYKLQFGNGGKKNDPRNQNQG